MSYLRYEVRDLRGSAGRDGPVADPVKDGRKPSACQRVGGTMQDGRPHEDSVMWINSSRFGKVEVEESRIISFPKGLLGFSKYKQYVLLEAGEDSYFWWLQSIELPDLAFVVTDPSVFVPTYQIPLKPEQMAEMGLLSLADAQVFVIVNKRGNVLTGNLQGPLVVHVHKRVGEQLVLSDRRFTTRVPLVELASEVQAASA